MTRSRISSVLALALLAGINTACGSPQSSAERTEGLQAVEARLNERFSPGLHTLMVELQHRHASLWFAGEAENWPLSDYFLHELEELVETIEEVHPEYDGIPVARLLGEMTAPALERLEEAVDGGDGAAFQTAFDQLTTGCNACHAASDRAALVVQRPTVPPVTNLRYAPAP